MKLFITRKDLIYTPEWLSHYKLDESFDVIKEFGDDFEKVSYLIAYCKLAQTPEMLEYYKSLNPALDDIYWLINHCEFAEENKDFLLN